PTLDEASVHPGFGRELSLKIACELWIVAGGEEQRSGHRVFRCTGMWLKRAACNPRALDQQPPQTLLQWELVPITDKQRRDLKNHEQRYDDSPRGGPGANFPSQVKADASDCAQNRDMDQIEGEGGRPQPLEPGPTQVSHERTTTRGQTEDEKNRPRHIRQPSPQRPGRVLPAHGGNDEQHDTRRLRRARNSHEFLSRRHQKDTGQEDAHQKIHKPRGSKPGDEVETSVVGLAMPQEEPEAARVTHGNDHWNPAATLSQHEEHNNRGEKIKEPLAADAP